MTFTTNPPEAEDSPVSWFPRDPADPNDCALYYAYGEHAPTTWGGRLECSDCATPLESESALDRIARTAATCANELHVEDIIEYGDCETCGHQEHV